MGSQCSFCQAKVNCQKSTQSQKGTMKLLSASLLVGYALADKWAQIGDLWQSLSKSDNVAEDDRKIMELFTISSVANYGCWCRFNMYKPYKGTAQDVVDEACEQWWKNYDCLHIDYSDSQNGVLCNLDTPYTDVIVSLQDPFDMATDYSAACSAVNADACAGTTAAPVAATTGAPAVVTTDPA